MDERTEVEKEKETYTWVCCLLLSHVHHSTFFAFCFLLVLTIAFRLESILCASHQLQREHKFDVRILVFCLRCLSVVIGVKSHTSRKYNFKILNQFGHNKIHGFMDWKDCIPWDFFSTQWQRKSNWRIHGKHVYTNEYLIWCYDFSPLILVAATDTMHRWWCEMRSWCFDWEGA